MNALRRVLRVLSALFLVIGIVQSIRWGRLFSLSDFEGIFHVFIACLINLLPAAALWGSTLILRRHQNSKWLHGLAVALCVFVLAGWGFITFGFEVFSGMTAEVTLVRKYSQILTNVWGSSDLVSHFPKSVPKDAHDVFFFYVPGFLQGGSSIQLRYKTTPEKTLSLHKQFEEQTTKTFYGGDMNTHMNMKDGMPTTFFYTSGTANHAFPSDYEIMVFDAIPKDRPKDISWNHGQSHGVAISTNNSEIVYWAEAW